MIEQVFMSSEVIIGASVLVVVSTVVGWFCYGSCRHRFGGPRSIYDDVITALASSSQVPGGNRSSKINNLIKYQTEAAVHAQTFACSTSSATLIEEALLLQSVVDKYDKLNKENVKEEIVIPKEVVGHLIGKLGNNIKQIKKESNTYIYLNERVLEDNEEWVCVIHGRKPEFVDQAKLLVAKVIDSSISNKVRNTFLTKEILVPKSCVGGIIGHGGKAIANIKEKSKTNVYIDMNRLQVCSDGKDYRFVVLKGKKEQIGHAERLILATIEGSTRSKHETRIETIRTESSKAGEQTGAEGTEAISVVMRNVNKSPFSHDRKVQVFVSCVYNPNLFWIQRIGKESIELRKLEHAMTHHYFEVHPWESYEPEANFKLGEIVAAPFFDKMYRARIIHLGKDENEVEVEYVDYGDRSSFEINLVRVLEPEFLRTKFQALAGSLNLECPSSKWPDETILKFSDLTHCAQWKSLTAKFKGFVTDDDDGDEMIERICLELIDCDLNIGEMLVEEGLARAKSVENAKMLKDKEPPSLN